MAGGCRGGPGVAAGCADPCSVLVGLPAVAGGVPQRGPRLRPATAEATPRPVAAGSEVVYQGSVVEGAMGQGPNMSWAEVVVGGLLASLITALAGWFFKLSGFGIFAGIVVGLWLFFVQVRAFFAYLFECGTAREAFLAASTMGLALVRDPVAAMMPAVQQVRAAAARSRVRQRPQADQLRLPPVRPRQRQIPGMGDLQQGRQAAA